MSSSMKDAASRQLGRLYETMEKNRLALSLMAHASNASAARMARSRHNTWLQAKSITEEAVYLFLALGGC